MTDFSYVDLVSMCEDAGFGEIHLEVSCDVTKRTPRTWESFAGFAPNPNAQSIAQELDSVFTTEEKITVEAHLRPLVEGGRGMERLIMAYVWATKL
jgi:hypothetical protein